MFCTAAATEATEQWAESYARVQTPALGPIKTMASGVSHLRSEATATAPATVCIIASQAADETHSQRSKDIFLSTAQAGQAPLSDIWQDAASLDDCVSVDAVGSTLLCCWWPSCQSVFERRLSKCELVPLQAWLTLISIWSLWQGTSDLPRAGIPTGPCHEVAQNF